MSLFTWLKRRGRQDAVTDLVDHEAFFETQDVTVVRPEQPSNGSVTLWGEKPVVAHAGDTLRVSVFGKVFADIRVERDLTLRCKWCREPLRWTIWRGGLCYSCYRGDM